MFYDRRPSVWVEPKGNWGRGAVMLVEIPTLDETFDNIVAFWNPAEKPQPGQELLFGYRLYWCRYNPVSSGSRRSLRTRTASAASSVRSAPTFRGASWWILPAAISRCWDEDAHDRTGDQRLARADRDHLGAAAACDQGLARHV